MGFPMDPEGFYEAIRGVSVLGKPIYITETGIADLTDLKRPEFIRSHIEQVSKDIVMQYWCCICGLTLLKGPGK